MDRIKVLIAGSTAHTVSCARSLWGNERFQVTAVLTPIPKPVGRKQELTKNPLHSWALEQQLPVVHVEKKLDSSVQAALGSQRPDILLVVDFGYIVPKWLLEFPMIAPVNIHPSDLPRYRGSSPGQFALIFGETESAVTLIVMDEKLDHGPIISKVHFQMEDRWTASDYYAQAFDLIGRELPQLLAEFVSHPQAVAPQDDESPTVTARMLKRDDGFVPLETLKALLSGEPTPLPVPFLAEYQLPTTAKQLYNLWRGLTPWPGIWTVKKQNGSEVRIKLLILELKGEKLKITKVQAEGKLPTENPGNLLD